MSAADIQKQLRDLPYGDHSVFAHLSSDRPEQTVTALRKMFPEIEVGVGNGNVSFTATKTQLLDLANSDTVYKITALKSYNRNTQLRQSVQANLDYIVGMQPI